MYCKGTYLLTSVVNPDPVRSETFSLIGSGNICFGSGSGQIKKT